MASVRASSRLNTGTLIRIVDSGASGNPRYVAEVSAGLDAMGADVWTQPESVSMKDFIATLIAIGFLAT